MNDHDRGREAGRENAGKANPVEAEVMSRVGDAFFGIISAGALAESKSYWKGFEAGQEEAKKDS